MPLVVAPADGVIVPEPTVLREAESDTAVSESPLTRPDTVTWLVPVLIDEPYVILWFFAVIVRALATTATLDTCVAETSLWFESPVNLYQTVYVPAVVPVGMVELYVPFCDVE